MKWVGKRTLKGGRLEVGRFWFAWRGWQHKANFRIGSTRVTSFGPIGIFIGPKKEADQ